MLLGLATVVFWVSVRSLPRFDGSEREEPGELTGRLLLEGLPLSALAAGGVLLLVFVASVTLCTRPDPWLPGTALGSALFALYAAPVVLGREPRPVGGALYSQPAVFLADAMGLAGRAPAALDTAGLPAAVSRPAVAAVGARGRQAVLAGRWGALYLVAVAGWVWRDALAPVAPPLLGALLLLLPLLHLPPLRRAVSAARPPGRGEPNG
ncbi:hypothetical protein ACR6C2_27340 [Streptomyces sp. INA 01156]